MKMGKLTTTRAKIARFFCNREAGTCMRRSPSSWAKILCYYVVFISICFGGVALALMFIIGNLKNPVFPKASLSAWASDD